MKTTNLAADIEIRQLAEQQYHELEVMATEPLLAGDDELRRGMKESAASVMQCIAEGYRHPGALQFQKNFLVIAKSFNAAFFVQLQHCAKKKYITPERLETLQAQNKNLENRILSAIGHLRQPARESALVIASEGVPKVPASFI